MRATSMFSSCALVVVLTSPGCDSAANSETKAQKSEAKPPGNAKDRGATPKPKPDAAAARDELHFDVSKDRSGTLARAASALETTDTLAEDEGLRRSLAELSHHAERGPSNEALCKHMASVPGAAKVGSPEECARTIEHQRVRLGPEVFTDVAACITAAKTGEDLDRCSVAEQEAERILHEKKHGDGLDRATCETLFVHFEKLAMADAGDHAELVEQTLEEVKADVIEGCIDQGTKREVECAMKAADMKTLGECDSTVL